MNYKLIMFDMDGTFIDSRQFHAKLFCGFFQRYWYPVSYERCYYAIGATVKQLFKEAAVPVERYDEFYRLLDEYYDHDGTALIPLTHVAEGFVTLLHWLKKRGIRTAVVTNSLNSVVKKIIAYHGLNGLFDDVIGADNNSVDKIRRCNILKSKYQIERENVLFVGDSESDMILANKMGYDACFAKTKISWYKDSRYIENVLRPRIVVNNFLELLMALEENMKRF